MIVKSHVQSNLCVIPRSLPFGDSEIERVSVYTYLGLEVDENLSFNQQCRKSINTISYRLKQLYKLRPRLTRSHASLIYKTMILPIMDSYDIFYIACSKKLLQKLDVLQNRGIRICNKMRKRTNTKDAQTAMG